ncbi:MAG: hypothetical protein D6808_03120 [Candidatus Dadabacteria bacterium]|nr:MAG: hypothetical protein D6808_03120 [Candidatus Dadabacteria bacterium]
MVSVVTAISLAMAIAACWCVLYPLFQEGSDPALQKDTSANEEDKARIIQMIKDLELDYQVGKLTRPQYEKAVMELKAKLSKAIREGKKPEK